ncbi:MAG: ATP-binding protein [Eubacteriales bacterium]
MAYNRDNFRALKAEYEKKRLRAEADAEANREALHRLSPDAKEIDRALAQTGMRIFETACRGDEHLSRRIAAIRAEQQSLLEARRALLQHLSLPPDYTEPHYECSLCHDTGYVDTRLCTCLRRALVLAGFRSSGIGKLIDRQNFDNFSLEYYRAAPKDYERMKENLRITRAYAENFSAGSGNLLLMGHTGLGKTHLSTAIARVVIERGYDVLYESAQNILHDFEHDQFHAGRGQEEPRAAKYYEAELLIIDDLGTEFQSTFSVSCLYNLINTRLNRGLAMLINTNLSSKELVERYDQRITSRLLGEFQTLLFVGKDIRYLK